ncbi:hypothetical protein Taro_041426 [Colocasia esculenta]|uniref:Retrotransposon gag domain-containing protein n=1 Tax=Colocasia esculenta TaxID=4460 RepID=A0A843X0I3_COLES|nr:hypothetical protein [Colocasia esculenta]
MQTQAQTTEALQAQVQVQAQAPAHEAVFGGVPMMERFRRMTPPFFKGERESDPILAESWLRETEKIFRAIRCTEEERVTLATYMLQERTDVWWSSVLRTQFGDGAMEVAWAEFVDLFRAKYIPEHVQDRMEQEFLTLTQGSMSVLQYEARFTELSKYATHIVADEWRKVKKFIMGLKPSLRTRLVTLGHRSMEEALSAACMQEAEMEVYLEEKRASLKRPASAFQRQDRKKKAPAFQKRAVVPARVAAPTPGGGTVAEKPVCTQCGKRHGGADYDAILGLDWLEEHYALMDCRQKLIIFQIHGKEEFVHPLPKNMSGKFVISALKAARMLSKGCCGFLANRRGSCSGFWRRERGPRKGIFVLIRAFLRLVDQGGLFVCKIQSFSKRGSCVGGGFGALEVGGGDCLIDKAGIFGLRFVTPVGGIEASCIGFAEAFFQELSASSGVQLWQRSTTAAAAIPAACSARLWGFVGRPVGPKAPIGSLFVNETGLDVTFLLPPIRVFVCMSAVWCALGGPLVSTMRKR